MTRRRLGPDRDDTDPGSDPDYRFSLANERTFLAWIRTSLGLIAASVAVVQVVPSFHVSGSRTALGVVLAAAGLGCSALAYRRWWINEQAMRHGRPLPPARGLAVLAAALTLVGLAVLVLIVVAQR